MSSISSANNVSVTNNLTVSGISTLNSLICSGTGTFSNSSTFNGNAIFNSNTTFNTAPIISGTNITSGTIPNTALSSQPVLLNGVQTITGFKSFTSTINGVIQQSNTIITTPTGSNSSFYIPFYPSSAGGIYQYTYLNNNLVYNPSTQVLTCGTISGNLSGNSSSSSQIFMNNSSSNTNYQISFTPANGSNQYLYSNSTMTINPNTSTISASIFNGNSTSATNISVLNTNTNSTFYPTFISGTGTSVQSYANSTLSFNPSNQTLVVGSVNSKLQTTSVSNNAIYYLTMVQNNSSSSQTLDVSNIPYNPSTATLTSNISGNLIGNLCILNSSIYYYDYTCPTYINTATTYNTSTLYKINPVLPNATPFNITIPTPSTYYQGLTLMFRKIGTTISNTFNIVTSGSLIFPLTSSTLVSSVSCGSTITILSFLCMSDNTSNYYWYQIQ